MTSSSRLVTDRWVRGQTITDRWDPHDVIMTSPTDKWVQRLCVADLWAWSMVSSGRVQTRSVGPGYGLGFGPPRGARWCGHVVLSATNRPWSTGAGEARFMVNPPVLVHRPQSRSMKDLVHLLLPRVRFTCTKCTDVWPARGKSPSSSPACSRRW